MIRMAAKEDMPHLLEMLRAFFDESGYRNEVSFDDASMEATCLQLMEHGCIFVAQHGDRYIGVSGALAYSFYFNQSHKTAQEIFWYVDPQFRGGPSGIRLIRALEAWAKEQGCKSISMISLSKLSGSPAADIYKRTGYRASEQNFIKVL